MNDLYLVFIAGLLGSAHCIGMCGGFVLAINTSRDSSRVLLHQVLYFGGKALTYTLMGAVAGLAGAAIMNAAGIRSSLSILAGVLMILIGLGLVGVIDRIRGFNRLTSFPGFKQAMAYFLNQRTPAGTLGLGLLNGLLPCGLVYGLLAKAAATGTIAGGALTMFVFGMATVPALFVLGMTGHLLRPAWRSRLNLAGGVIVILMGLLTIVRGTPAMGAVMALFHGDSHGGTHQVDEMPPSHDHMMH